jgi:hypothetical protein
MIIVDHLQITLAPCRCPASSSTTEEQVPPRRWMFSSGGGRSKEQSWSDAESHNRDIYTVALTLAKANRDYSSPIYRVGNQNYLDKRMLMD